MEFVTEYEHLCKACASTLKSVVDMYKLGLMPDTDDPEAPINYCYDHSLFCGGAHCRALPDGSRPEMGDKVMTPWAVAIVDDWDGHFGEYHVVHRPGQGIVTDLGSREAWLEPKDLEMYHGDTTEEEAA